ncbi:MAG: serine hydrolase domain-containing protein [Polaribacter sp.]
MKLNFLVLLVSCLIVSCGNAQEKNSEKENSLFFSKEEITQNNIHTKNYTDLFTLNKEEYLNIHFTLKKPLVKSLQELAPNLSEDQLLEKGNFQFSFLVDGEVIYVENLHKGAGFKASKTTQLKHTIRLVTPKKIDYWGWFMWLKFMKLGGGQDKLNKGNHSLTIEVRPYLKENNLKVGAVLAKGKLPVEVAEIPVDKSLIPLQKIAKNSGWKVSSDNFDKIKIEALNRKIAENRFEKINGIVVIKNNELLIEQYFNGENRNSLHDPKSVGKSIASTMLGIAIEEKFIKNENLQLKDFYNLKSFKNYNNKKEEVTLKSLLTMSSGFVGNDNDYGSLGNEEKMYPTKNWVKFALDLPMEENKIMEKDFSYFTAGIVVLGDVIEKSVPKGLVSYADKKLFKPLNIIDYQWEFTPQKIGNTAGGIRLRAIDFAKYGQLYKNNGVWSGQQVLPKKWVEKSLSKQVEISSNEFYGYLFWNKTYKVGTKEYEVSYASGNGGNKIFIFKDIPFVVVITSSAYNFPNAHKNADKMMTDYILPAVLNK